MKYNHEIVLIALVINILQKMKSIKGDVLVI